MAQAPVLTTRATDAQPAQFMLTIGCSILSYRIPEDEGLFGQTKPSDSAAIAVSRLSARPYFLR